MMGGRPGGLAVVLVLAAAGGLPAQAPITSGVSALARRDVDGAVREFRRAVEDGGPSTAAAGELWLGHIAWAVRGDAASAATHLERAMHGTADSAAVYIERGRLAAYRRHFRDATATATRAMRFTADPEHRGAGARAVVSLSMDAAFAALAAKHRVDDSVRSDVVRNALDTLSQRVSRLPGRTDDARALIDAGILVGDSAAIDAGLVSWKLLDHDTSRADPPARGTSPPPGDPELARAVQLSSARLYEEVALLLERRRQRSHEHFSHPLEDAAAYGLFLRETDAMVDAYNRRAVAGTARPGDLDRALNARSRLLWPRLYWPTHVPPFYPAAFVPELRKRFNTVLTVDRTGKPAELFLAQVIETYPARTPADSSHKWRRALMLDAPVANGFDAWLTDRVAGRAAWTIADTIFEMRPAFADLPYLEWTSLTDSAAASAQAARIARDSAADVTRARRDSAGYLPGVAERIFRQGTRAIFDSVAALPMGDSAKEAAFVRALFDAMTASAIGLHEGRHVMDAHIPGRKASGVDAEFRAKIDEVTGAPYPRVALTAILSPDIGDASSHGQANRRIMIGLIHWLRTHSSEVLGYRTSQPPLTQLPLLTDDQLRSAFLSLASR